MSCFQRIYRKFIISSLSTSQKENMESDF